ncbi:TonB-dependent siderophore receptor [Achromobacter insuavis]|uniref:TonB-dependent siderophore receptor n=1 Tax=Achromobacter insuavis TaxID=1287735 RepID=UPI001F13FBCF
MSIIRSHKPRLAPPAPWRARIGALSLAASLGAQLAPAAALAQPAAININIPAQTLNQALLQLGQQAPIQIYFLPELVAGLKARPVSGVMTPEQALEQLLQGTGIQYVRNGDSITLKAGPGAVHLAPVTVTGSYDATSENTRSYAAQAVTLGKTTETLRETPQSVTVITSRQIEDRGMTTLADAMSAATGITVVPDEYVTGGKYFSRGFQITDIRVDGGAVAALGKNDFIADPELIKYDRIEVLRGADGLYSGAGEPGGTINLVRKRPLDNFQIKGSVSAGSWDNYRAVADLSSPLLDNGKLRGRVVAATDTRHYFYDTGKSAGQTFYGVLEADIGPGTTAMLGASYDKRRETPWYYGLPRYTNGQDIGLARSTSLATDWSAKRHEAWDIFGDIKHTFANGWKASLSATHSAQHYHDKYGYLSGAVDPATGDGMAYSGSYFRSSGYQNQFDANLAGNFDLLGRSHDFIVGADYSKHKAHAKRADLTGGSAVNLADLSQTYWREPDTPEFGVGTSYIDFPYYGEERSGAYARLRLSLADPLHLIGGLRYSNYKQFLERSGIADDGTANWTERYNFKDNDVITPFGAVTYDLNADWTTYISYAEIYKPQAGYLSGPQPGKPLDPITGRTYEWGVKGSHMGGKLNTSAALYYTERNGEAVPDGRYPNESNPEDGAACCYTAQGKVVSRGVDLEASGELAPGWQVYAGYTYNNNKDKRGGQRYAKNTPAHLFKLWSTYRLPGQLNKWMVGGGVAMQSKSSVAGQEWVQSGGEWSQAAYTTRQGGYTVANALVQYDISQSMSATLNINNLFDKRYYAGLGSNSKNNYYGTPRNVMLTMRASF